MKAIIALAFFSSMPAFAQTSLSTGTLEGTIQDESGGVVPGAKVIATEASKGLVRESLTDDAGAFLFPAVITGFYNVRVEKQGFKAEEMRGLQIQVGEQASVVIRLRVGEIRTATTVILPTLTELDAESNTLGSVVDSAEVEQLPLNGRNLLELALLAAPAVNTTSANNLFTTNVGPPDRTIVLPGTLRLR